MMGCSNPHPHGQAWSLSYIPAEAQTVLSSLREYDRRGSTNLLLDYAQNEIACKSPRLIVNGMHFAAMVPFWALWPYEVLICPTKRRIPNLTEMSSEEQDDLAVVFRHMTCKYDNRESKLCNEVF